MDSFPVRHLIRLLKLEKKDVVIKHQGFLNKICLVKTWQIWLHNTGQYKTYEVLMGPGRMATPLRHVTFHKSRTILP